MVKISIIIPTKNEEDNLKNLLTSIKNQNWDKHKSLKYEIIVADADSTDKTKEVAKKFNAKLVLGGLPGRGRNNGAKKASGSILFMIDADVLIKNKNFFFIASNEFLRRKWDCAAVDNKPIFFNNIKKNKREAINFIYNFGNFFIRQSQFSKNPRANGTCMLFKRNSFLKVKGFNEKIYFGEDSEIAKRMVKKGFRFGVLNSKISVNVSPRRLLKQGIGNYALNVIILDSYRTLKGEITSKKTYSQLTKLKDHFEK